MLAGEMYSEGTVRPRFTGSPFKIRRPSRTASWPTRVGNVTAPPRLCFATHFSHPLYSSPGDMTTSFRRPASSKASATPIDIWPAGENTPSIRRPDVDRRGRGLRGSGAPEGGRHVDRHL